ncbi:MAG: HD domain-containing protein [Dehalococcoidales bacterium]|nr:HD domain-containing protein [Dehalococcoidales bacterium]
MSLHNRLAAKEGDKFDLLEKLWARMKPEEKEDQLISHIMQMTHSALNASASSMLLLDDRHQKLYFKYANGPVGPELKRLHISRQSGIAGWIVRNGKPLLVNDPEKNKNFYKQIDTVTGFKTRNIIGVPIIIENKVIGVIEVLNKADGTDFTRKDMNTMLGVASTTAIAMETTRMNVELLNSYKGTVSAVVSLADAKEISGNGHSRRVADYALKAAAELALPKEDRSDIEYAALFHDIGKLSMPDRIINKAEALTEEEWARIRKHPLIGYKLFCNIPFLKEPARLILYHHERYDGRGYPEGIQGENIPLGSRLIAVADAFDYMTTGHAHREALSKARAFTELYQNSRTQFCPVAVKALCVGLNQKS